MLEVNGHSCVNIDHYEAVGILKAAGSVIALRVERDEYPEGILGESYENEPPSISKILPPPLQTSSNSNNQDHVQISQEFSQLFVKFMVMKKLCS